MTMTTVGFHASEELSESYGEDGRVTGAYGYAMASNYNKVLRPPVVFVGAGGYRTVTRRETVEDLLGLDVDEPALSHCVP